MVDQLYGIGCLAIAALVTVRTLVEFRADNASLKFKWTYPKLEADRVGDPLGFWLLIAAKLLIVIALGYVGVRLVVGA